jgi:small neutral amino acid transporter SnatA (MarC family)
VVADMTIASAALLLFLILDPLGNIPVFLSLLRPLPSHRRRIVLVRELLIALAVLMVFLWGGKYALDLMHLRQESVSIAGGIVLFLNCPAASPSSCRWRFPSLPAPPAWPR